MDAMGEQVIVRIMQPNPNPERSSLGGIDGWNPGLINDATTAKPLIDDLTAACAANDGPVRRGYQDQVKLDMLKLFAQHYNH